MKVKYYTESEVRKLVQKSKDEGFNEGIQSVIEKVLSVSQYVLDAKFGFTPAKLRRFSEEFNYYTDSILTDYLTFEEVKEAVDDVLKENK